MIDDYDTIVIKKFKISMESDNLTCDLYIIFVN